MAGNLKKFVNPRFIKTIDLELMKTLLARHEGKFTDFSLDQLDQVEEKACPSGEPHLQRVIEPCYAV